MDEGRMRREDGFGRDRRRSEGRGREGVRRLEKNRRGKGGKNGSPVIRDPLRDERGALLGRNDGFELGERWLSWGRWEVRRPRIRRCKKCREEGFLRLNASLTTLR